MSKVVFFLFVTVCAFGCQRNVIPFELEREIHSVPDRFERGSGNLFCMDLAKRIGSHTNVAVRFAGYRLLWETLNAIKIDGQDSRQSAILIRCVNDRLDGANYGLCKNGLPRAKAIENIVERFRWMKLQGDRLRPTHRISYYEFSLEDRRKYDEWRGSYLWCRGHYEERLYMLEKYCTMKLITVGGKSLTDEEREWFCTQMEEFLGRPLRTLEQLRAMRNVDSEEIKAVKRKEVGPACFARESDPPVSFPPIEVPKCETNKVPDEIGVEITERGSVPT